MREDSLPVCSSYLIEYPVKEFDEPEMVDKEAGRGDAQFWTLLGRSWYDGFYQNIIDSLGYDSRADGRSAGILSSLLSSRNRPTDFIFLRKMFKGNSTVVFGAGPSLKADLEGLEEFIVQRKPVVVAADGAADALVDVGIISSIIVTDLDSCSETSLRIVNENGSVFAHAHGDNISLLEFIIPKLTTNVYGTCQSIPKFLVRNFGGFTDGDRACYVSCFFSPSRIILGGMDFDCSTEGTYLVNRYRKTENDEERMLKL